MKNNEAIITDEDLGLIGKFTRKQMSRDELYVFPLILCDNEIDRDNEKFTVSALEELAKLFIGKTGIFDHDMSSKDQTARIYSTEIRTDDTKKTADGEPYTYISAKAYMVRTEKNKDLIAEIDAGIKKETSVGCSVKSVICSVCGKNIRSEHCEHIKGNVYSGKLCCYLLTDPADAYEWSFVAVPAQKNAGVTKSYVRSKSDPDLEALAAEYKEEMTACIVKDSANVIPSISPETLKGICSSLTLSQLRDMRDALSVEAKKKLPLVRQLEVRSENSSEEINDYLI